MERAVLRNVKKKGRSDSDETQWLREESSSSGGETEIMLEESKGDDDDDDDSAIELTTIKLDHVE